MQRYHLKGSVPAACSYRSSVHKGSRLPAYLPVNTWYFLSPSSYQGLPVTVPTGDGSVSRYHQSPSLVHHLGPLYTYLSFCCSWEKQKNWEKKDWWPHMRHGLPAISQSPRDGVGLTPLSALSTPTYLPSRRRQAACAHPAGRLYRRAVQCSAVPPVSQSVREILPQWKISSQLSWCYLLGGWWTPVSTPVSTPTWKESKRPAAISLPLRVANTCGGCAEAVEVAVLVHSARRPPSPSARVAPHKTTVR
jgi:hypothetical protein